MNYAIVGYGRMGREIEREASRRGHRCVARVDRGSTDSWGGADVAFEFTEPGAAEDNLLRMLDAGIRVVCGTTGWELGPRLVDAAAGSRGGLIVAANFSLGMNLFFRVAQFAARTMGTAGGYRPSVWESHHAGKQDVPSGTARRIGRIVSENDPRAWRLVEGHPDGPLPEDAIQVVGVRAGHEPGTHVLGFDGAEDRITLEHRARGRGGFALGAVLAGEWLREKQGLHTFDEVVDAILDAGGAPSAGEEN